MTRTTRRTTIAIACAALAGSIAAHLTPALDSTPAAAAVSSVPPRAPLTLASDIAREGGPSTALHVTLAPAGRGDREALLSITATERGYAGPIVADSSRCGQRVLIGPTISRGPSATYILEIGAGTRCDIVWGDALGQRATLSLTSPERIVE